MWGKVFLLCLPILLLWGAFKVGIKAFAAEIEENENLPPLVILAFNLIGWLYTAWAFFQIMEI